VILGAYSFASFTGDQPHSEKSWSVQPIVGFRIVRKPDAWLSAGCLIAGYDYEQDGFYQEYIRVVAYANFKLRF